MARPKIYDNEQVLTSIMVKFWQQGYEATGMRDLVETTGLRASSLYHNFGNKEDLFLLSLDFYIENIISPRINKYLHQENPVLGLQQFFTSCFSDLPKDMNGTACLMLNTMAELASHNDNVRAKLKADEKQLKKEFSAVIERAKSTEQISLDLDTAQLADQLVLTLNGLLLSSKIVKNERKMVMASKQALSFLLREVNA